MERFTTAAWLTLMLIHLPPAAVFFFPSLTTTLYRISADTTEGILLVHRGALFLCIASAALWAAFDPWARFGCSILVSISLVGFLLVYLRAGTPAGALRTIAVVDAFGLVPLAFVLLSFFVKPK